MSGYNAEYGIPAGDNDNAEELNGTLEELPAETPAPIILEKSDLEKAQELVEELRAELRKERYNDIPADDHRLTHIWESASEIADRRGYCDVFDSIMEELGTGYTREMEYCVTVTETIQYDVHVTAPRNATQADIEELIQYETLSDHTETDRNWEVDNYESAD